MTQPSSWSSAAPVVLAAVAVALLATPARAQSTAAADEQAVRQLEDRRVKALIADDLPALEAILADDLTYGHSNGVLDTKASYVETLRSGKTKYEAFDRQPSVVRVYGDSAIVTGTASVKLRAQPAPFSLRYTLVYVKRGGAWTMAAWQSTRLP